MINQSKVVEEQKQQIAQLETKLLRSAEQLNLTKQKHNEMNFQLVQSNVLLQNTVNDQQKLIRSLRNEKEELQVQLGKVKSENAFLSSQIRFLKEEQFSKNEVVEYFQKFEKKLDEVVLTSSSSSSSSSSSLILNNVHQHQQQTSKQQKKKRVLKKDLPLSPIVIPKHISPPPLCIEEEVESEDKENEFKVPTQPSLIRNLIPTSVKATFPNNNHIIKKSHVDQTPKLKTEIPIPNLMIDQMQVINNNSSEVKVTTSQYRSDISEFMNEPLLFRPSTSNCLLSLVDESCIEEGKDQSLSSTSDAFSEKSLPVRKRNLRPITQLPSFAEPSLRCKLRKKEN